VSLLKEGRVVNIFKALIIISFLFAVSLIFFFDFLYKKLKVCFERMNEEIFEIIQDIKLKSTKHRIITENIQNKSEKFR